MLRDLTETLEKLAPRKARYHHHTEGPDDMPAHIRSMLTATSLGIPVSAGSAVLGTWQAIYLIEHRDLPLKCGGVILGSDSTRPAYPTCEKPVPGGARLIAGGDPIDSIWVVR